MSLRGVAWQYRTPSSSNVSGQPWDHATVSSSSFESVHSSGSRSQLPRTNVRVDRTNQARCFCRLRTEEEITAKDDRIDVLPLDLGEHRLERGATAVDVVERGDAQGLFQDLEHDAVVRPRSARAHDRAQRPRDAALAADHLADVGLRDAQLEDCHALAMNLLDLDRVGVVDEMPCQVREQLSQ